MIYNKTMRNTFRSLVLILATTFISNFGYSQNNGFEVIRSLEIMNEIYENLEKYYVDDLKSGSMSKAAIDAMLKDLDPYTVYYHETDIEDYQLMTTGQYGGIGALIRKVDDYTSQSHTKGNLHKLRDCAQEIKS